MDERNEETLDERALEAAMEAELKGGDEPGPAAEFSEFRRDGVNGEPAGLHMLYDLHMPVAIELGRTRMSVQEILTLGRGSVIQLDRLAGEPVDVFVGDRRFAEGEVVVVGEQFGVRITRILSTGVDNTAESAAESAA
jgi:flagellar motor switch protein FliN/FliY